MLKGSTHIKALGPAFVRRRIYSADADDAARVMDASPGRVRRVIGVTCEQRVRRWRELAEQRNRSRPAGQ